jgi:hypothetical protein
MFLCFLCVWSFVYLHLLKGKKVAGGDLPHLADHSEGREAGTAIL